MSTPPVGIEPTIPQRTTVFKTALHANWRSTAYTTLSGLEPPHRLPDYSRFSKPLPCQLGLQRHFYIFKSFTGVTRFELIPMVSKTIALTIKLYPYTDPVGFEPTLTGLEPVVLPLHQRPLNKDLFEWIYRYYHKFIHCGMHYMC